MARNEEKWIFKGATKHSSPLITTHLLLSLSSSSGLLGSSLGLLGSGILLTNLELTRGFTVNDLLGSKKSSQSSVDQIVLGG